MSTIDSHSTTRTPYIRWEFCTPTTGARVLGKNVNARTFQAEDDFVSFWDELAEQTAFLLAKPILWDRILEVEQSAKTVPAEEVIDHATKLRRAQHYLSLNVTELAEVMGVERQSIHAWLNGKNIRRANRGRIEDVFRLARTWWTMTGTPIREFRHTKNAGGESLLDLLKEEPIPHERVIALFNSIASSSTASAPPEGAGQEIKPSPVSDAVRAASIRRLSRRMRR